MRILAIDPGYERLGIAVMEKKGRDETAIFSECFKTSAKLPHCERLKLISKEVERVIDEYKPETLAIETLFFNVNQKTVMAVSEARGAIIAKASGKNLSVFEYTPLQIKMAICGYGRGDKKQVIDMVKKILKSPSLSKIKYDDEFDALAVGLTHFASYKYAERTRIKTNQSNG